MKKKISLLVIALVAFTVLLSFVVTSCEDDSSVYYGGTVDDGYSITTARYDIIVSSDHTANVTETLTVKFFEPSSGISRYLPTNSGEQYRNITVIGDEYYVESDVNFINVYTGEDYSYSYGGGDEVTYVISYEIVPPTRTVSNTNYYMNVVPFGWSTSQQNVTVNMSFPFEIKDALVYKGKYGTTKTYDDYSVSEDGKSISIYTSLSAYNGITVDVELGQKFDVNFSLVGLLSIIVILVLTSVSVVIKAIVIKDKSVVPVLNSVPPTIDGVTLDPMQTGYLIDGSCEDTDVTSLIFYFASKGLVRLDDKGENDFTITKIGEIDHAAPLHQKIIFQGLFKSGDTVSPKQLEDRFYVDSARAKQNVTEEYKDKLYDGKAKRLSVVTAVLSVFIVALIITIASCAVNVTLLYGGIFIAAVIVALFGFVSFQIGRSIFKNKHKYSKRKTAVMIAVSVIVAILASLIASHSLLGGIFPFYGRIIIFIGVSVVCFVCGTVGKKTDYYASIINDLSGFKVFLETAEKDRLELMLKENPQYYYDILPYANVLGVSKIWQDKFEKLTSVPAPDYYYGPSVFDLVLFNRMMRMSFVRMNVAMASRPSGNSTPGSFSGGGGFGGFGGGFGGGGFGGGGGGRR